MRILSIETSCDETAVSIIEANGDFPNAEYKILGNSIFSQIDIHREYGGVFPSVAKREHAKTLVPMLERSLKEADLLSEGNLSLTKERKENLKEILQREPETINLIIEFFEKYKKPEIDLISVTSGPGLEPALWVGINFARALSYHWELPVVPVNHMEGHILSSIYTEDKIREISFPALSLLISGGHTELVMLDSWKEYDVVGETRDDAVGEAFDKVARMLGLPYPGGPEISKLAKVAREKNLPEFSELPRPMLDSKDLDFSFSGLKTAVRYAIDGKELSEDDVASIARDFEDAVTEVLLKKTQKAIDQTGAKTLIIGGGVSANTNIKEKFTELFEDEYPEMKVYFPPKDLSTDNSVMIALAGHAHVEDAKKFEELTDLKADGNLSL